MGWCWKRAAQYYPGFSIHGWNGSGQGIYGWKSVDDIELSFYNICKPLVDHPTGMQGYIAGDKCMNILIITGS